MNRLLILIIAVTLVIGSSFVHANNEKSYVNISSKNGGGWCFIFDRVYGTWVSNEAFPGRSIQVRPGNITVAFDNEYNGGNPGVNSEYHVVSVKEGESLIVKVQMEFKNKSKL